MGYDMKYNIGVICILFILLHFFGCSGPSQRVTRITAEEVEDLSGRWNDRDSRLVAEEMVTDLLDRAWLSNFIRRNGARPVVIVGNVRNMSSEHIETGIFIRNIERELINSGRVSFVAGGKIREEIRDERHDQQYHASEETAKRLAQETGADYMLFGSIKTLVDALGSREIKLYQVDMELIHLETNEKAWIGIKEIRKDINRARTRW